jgi:hypothetical protein
MMHALFYYKFSHYFFILVQSNNPELKIKKNQNLNTKSRQL